MTTMAKSSPNPRQTFSRIEDISLRIGNILYAMDNGLADIIDSPAGAEMRDPLGQIFGLVQVLHDYQAELQQCAATAWRHCDLSVD